MQNDLRQNPRFVSNGGVSARALIKGEERAGRLQNFSSTGFAILLAGEVGDMDGAALNVYFVPPGSAGEELELSAIVSNRAQDGENTRLGCRITDMHGQAEAYFSFLTKMMFSQGLIRSMATKPVKCRTPAAG